MTRDERERLGDIAGAIETIRTHAVDTSAGERIKRDAILYNLVILGEAVKGLGEEIRAQEPEIPWRQIAGLRDLLSHEYAYHFEALFAALQMFDFGLTEQRLMSDYFV